MFVPGNPRQEPRGCRFIDGDPRQQGWTFCQRPTDGGSWCPDHHSVVFAESERPTKRDIDRMARQFGR